MTEQQASSMSYCEVCTRDMRQDTELKRFGKFCCSDEQIELYINAKQIELGLEEQRCLKRRRERRWFGGC